MGFYNNLETWQGLSVVDWTPESGPLSAETAYRIRLEWEDEGTWADRFAQFLEQPGVKTITTLVVGAWGALTDGDETLTSVVEVLAGAREHLPALTALFLGDITSEECEVSWIALADVSPLFHAYPKFEHFAVRGGMRDEVGLTFGVLKHAHLKSLAVETGGLAVSVIEEISIAELPELEHLELYLGTERYGGDATPDDLHTILTQAHEKWPKLRYLGLRDYDRADELAGHLASKSSEPLLHHIETLDLSLGTLGNSGATALLECPAITTLKKLDIHYHFVTEATVTKLMTLGIELDASDPQEPDKDGDEEWRYVAVSE
ncbi:STM4015 family protein [Armatimonas sp.]|uniref:STM4015 family protein n=1 Tax=Armatimonas sp. TaxID=1872638 RepID=UPI00286D26C5|nr:STM4015 family protein [Armatimonas sp.]